MGMFQAWKEHEDSSRVDWGAAPLLGHERCTGAEVHAPSVDHQVEHTTAAFTQAVLQRLCYDTAMAHLRIMASAGST